MMTIRAVWSETPAAAAAFLEATAGPRMAAASSLVLLEVAATVASASVRPATRERHESQLGSEAVGSSATMPSSGKWSPYLATGTATQGWTTAWRRPSRTVSGDGKLAKRMAPGVNQLFSRSPGKEIHGGRISAPDIAVCVRVSMVPKHRYDFLVLIFYVFQTFKGQTRRHLSKFDSILKNLAKI
jgi:hypothetical protein